MKFDDVAVGQRFELLDHDWIKLYQTIAVDLHTHEIHVLKDLNTEVNLITKCGNCIHYEKPDGKDRLHYGQCELGCSDE